MIFDYIDSIIQLVYENPDMFVTTLFTSVSNFKVMKKWLNKQNITFLWLDQLTDEELHLLIGRKEVIQIEALLHRDIQGELDAFIAKNRLETHFICIPGKDKDNHVNQIFIDKNKMQEFKREDSLVLHPDKLLDEESYMFSNPSKIMVEVLLNADKWPGILKINLHEVDFIPIQNEQELKDVLAGNTIEKEQANDSFFLHLSDLHLGTKKKNSGAAALVRSLDNIYPLLPKNNQLKILITGDLMNSPNRRNMYLASGLMNDLKKRYRADITFILGNHDVIVHGLNLLRVQKAKVVAYLLGENIKVLEKEKIILIKINSAYEGNLARGKVGRQQLREIDEELAAISNLEDYQLMVMIHHHVFPINKADFLKKKWNEKKVLGKLIESSKELVDSDILVNWLQKRHVQYILHGHKHIPYFAKYHQFHVVSCGSSCGYLKESNMKYLSYNILKYDNVTHQMKVCLICYDSASGNEGKRIEVHLFK